MAMSENLPAIKQDTAVGFATSDGFELMQRQAKVLSASQLVPKEYQGNLPNCIIALEVANRIGASPLAVLQNLYIVHGKPSWSSQFIIAAINSTGRFTPLRFDVHGEGDTKRCIAWAIEKATGERLESPPVSIQMARDEGWVSKPGSKWKTMPDLMLRYRSATFFGRLYAPEILMGMQTMEESIDVGGSQETRRAELAARFSDEPEDKVLVGGEFIDVEPSNPVLSPGECPNNPGDHYTAERCADCKERQGCPAWT